MVIDQLDLVIGVDGPAVHVAGAMGKSVWVLLTYVPEWRWLLTGETTPWYPTVSLVSAGSTWSLDGGVGAGGAGTRTKGVAIPKFTL